VYNFPTSRRKRTRYLDAVVLVVFQNVEETV